MKKKVSYILAICIMVMLCIVPSSNSAGIKKVIGIASQCDTASAGCFAIPANLSVVCRNTLNQSTCPMTFHPSWTTANRLWGVTGNTGGANYECVTSTNLGGTWVACATQPWGAGQQHQVASTWDGSLISVADVAGSCTVRKSTDNAATWNTTFTSVGIQCGMGSRAQIVYCQQTSAQCDVGNTLSGANARLHRSIDNGDNWTVQNPSDAVVAAAIGGVEFDGSNGVFGAELATGNKSIYTTSGVWGVSLSWPGAAVNYVRATPLLFGGATPQLISQNGATANYVRTDVDGVAIQTFSPTGATAALSAGARAVYWGSGTYYLVWPSTTGLAIGVTTDTFNSFIVLSDTTIATGRITMYRLGSSILISLNIGGTVGTFIKIT